MNKEELNFVFLSPDEIKGWHIKECKKLLEFGGESVTDNFEFNIINNVKIIGMCLFNNDVVGVRALKIPSKEKVSRYIERSGCENVEFKYEMGYASVHPKMRNMGIYKILTKKMLEYIDGPTYVITKLENEAVKRTLTNFGFKIIGNPFESIINVNKKLIMISNV